MTGFVTGDYLKNCAQRLRALAATEPVAERAALINEMAIGFAREADAMEQRQISASAQSSHTTLTTGGA
jgi:hypothetical protein